jgi:Family of unknown function (DUF6338)
VADSGLVDQAGSILLFVAPGFFARVAYQARFPQRESGDLYSLVVSVAASVPIVALGHLVAQKASISRSPTNLGYVVVLLGIAVIAGYLIGLLRDSGGARQALRELGLAYEPEATMMERTVLKMPEGGVLTVDFKDGRKAWGYPAFGTGYIEDDEARELYLAWPQWLDDETGEWIKDANGLAGVVINLDEVVALGLTASPPLGARRRFLRLSLGRVPPDPVLGPPDFLRVVGERRET